MDKFWQALAALLPTGYAWPRDPSSTLMRVVRAIALALHELHQFSRLTANQFQPHQTISRLAEWEEACGLPDKCFVDASPAQRRQLLLLRLRGPRLAYSDSSPAAPGAIVALCAALGYTVTVSYNTPFRVNVNRMGQRLGALNGQLNITVSVPSTPLRVGLGRVGDRLINRPYDASALPCYLEQILPARFNPSYLFI